MKKFMMLCVVFLMAFSISSCGKKDKDENAEAETTETDGEKAENGEKAEGDAAEGEKAEETKKTSKREVEIINNIGKDLSSARIRPSDTSDWSANLLVEDVWKDGYALPITLKGDYPEGDAGWEVEVTYAEDSKTDVWKGVPINTAKQITLTPTGSNY